MRQKFYFDYLGWIDIIAGVGMVLMIFDIRLPLLWFIGIFLLFKGIWSMLSAI